jgi:hypothetical protein
VNSLAHRKSLLKQTRVFSRQSSLEDFGFEPRTSSPRPFPEISLGFRLTGFVEVAGLTGMAIDGVAVPVYFGG